MCFIGHLEAGQFSAFAYCKLLLASHASLQSETAEIRNKVEARLVREQWKREKN